MPRHSLGFEQEEFIEEKEPFAMLSFYTQSDDDYVGITYVETVPVFSDDEILDEMDYEYGVELLGISDSLLDYQDARSELFLHYFGIDWIKYMFEAEYMHMHSEGYTDEEIYKCLEDEGYLYIKGQQPNEFITEDDPSSDEFMDNHSGDHKIIRFYGPDPDTYPEWLWREIKNNEDLREELQWHSDIEARDRVFNALRRGISQSKEDIKHLIGSTAGDIVEEYGLPRDAKKLLALATNKVVKTLGFNEAAEAITWIKPDQKKLGPGKKKDTLALPWRQRVR
jgi:hypothetical protein